MLKMVEKPFYSLNFVVSSDDRVSDLRQKGPGFDSLCLILEFYCV